jgi:hypothetical protein
MHTEQSVSQRRGHFHMVKYLFIHNAGSRRRRLTRVSYCKDVSAYLCDCTGTGIHYVIKIKLHKRNNALITKEMNGFLSLNELIESEMRVGNP